ncbi:uncharacterized protein CMU_019780 [Cryptosporidium muris RN66]|uniref:Uncharacterized protein n=1 Tax=Cryptosporidium muris (strain RN66) TaxID=441375 RepID=B6AJ97_CRYMR|nr:uncharacterized protein CMU_019780 [Cryptosporidium muris RN66]EEA08235.1 hypothetical protein CMU_019780 [Cryptosporidium muris RN66]|eukprot:XP_002142584.1 hypothetical protein [Cryptosporidium muris RN66]
MNNLLSRFFVYKFILVILLQFSYIYTQPIYPKFVKEWVKNISPLFLNGGYRLSISTSLEELFTKHLQGRDVYKSCIILLKSNIEVFDNNNKEWGVIDDETAEKLCTTIDPLKSMECSGLIEPLISYAYSIREFVQKRSIEAPDLRAACILVSEIGPKRPFGLLNKGDIKKRCEDFCNNNMSNMNMFEGDYCLNYIQLCKAIDFTLDNDFYSLTPQDFGMAVAISTMFGEMEPKAKITLRDGCRFMKYIIDKGLITKNINDISEYSFELALSEFFASRLHNIGIIDKPSTDINTFLNSRSTSLVLLHKEIIRAIKSISQISDKKVLLRTTNNKIKSSKSSKIENDKYIDDISDIIEESNLSLGIYSPINKEYNFNGAQKTWSIILRKEILSRINIIPNIDYLISDIVTSIRSNRVFITCLNAMKESGIHISKSIMFSACYKIDPFSFHDCQRLNIFDLQYIINLQKKLEFEINGPIDLRDLCSFSTQLTPSDLHNIEEDDIYNSCISSLLESHISTKYNFNKTVRHNACKKSDFSIRTPCLNIMQSIYKSDYSKIEMVFTLAKSLVNSDRYSDVYLKLLRSGNPSNFPKFSDLCMAVNRMNSNTFEECKSEIEYILRPFSSNYIFDINKGCSKITEETRYYKPQVRRSYYSQHRYIPTLYLPKRSELFELIDSPELLESPELFDVDYSKPAGMYRLSDGSIQYFNGKRYKINGNWWIKLGDKWMVDIPINTFNTRPNQYITLYPYFYPTQADNTIYYLDLSNKTSTSDTNKNKRKKKNRHKTRSIGIMTD